MKNGFVLALYDFASKQNYIYRTSKIKEISGASALLDRMYGEFIKLLSKNEFIVERDFEKPFKMSDFEAGSEDGAVLYEGGGNLMVLYRSREKYVLANKIISKYLVESVPGLNLITCCVDCNGNFIEDRHNLYEENKIRKNQAPSISVSAVLPITQIDQLTYMPVFEKKTEKNGEELTLSEDRTVKRKAYEKKSDSNIEELDEGMLAVIYVDGNSMGNHLKNSIPEYSKEVFMSYDDGVERLRAFSNDVHKCFVTETSKAISSYVKNQELSKKGFRQVIGGGDEITIICNAEIAYDVLQVYIEALNNSNEKRIAEKDGAQPYYACAGIAVFHAKSPFSIAYEIAEAACESAKKRSREKEGNYFDVYYCHAGIVDEFDNLRKNEEKITGRPYKVEDAKAEFSKYLHIIQEAGRANVKAIGAAARKSVSLYKIEAQRINAYLRKKQAKFSDGDIKLFAFADDENIDDIKIREEMKTVFDMSEYYDLWFSKRGEK